VWRTDDRSSNSVATSTFRCVNRSHSTSRKGCIVILVEYDGMTIACDALTAIEARLIAEACADLRHRAQTHRRHSCSCTSSLCLPEYSALKSEMPSTPRVKASPSITNCRPTSIAEGDAFDPEPNSMLLFLASWNRLQAVPKWKMGPAICSVAGVKSTIATGRYSVESAEPASKACVPRAARRSSRDLDSVKHAAPRWVCRRHLPADPRVSASQAPTPCSPSLRSTSPRRFSLPGGRWKVSASG